MKAIRNRHRNTHHTSEKAGRGQEGKGFFSTMSKSKKPFFHSSTSRVKTKRKRPDNEEIKTPKIQLKKAATPALQKRSGEGITADLALLSDRPIFALGQWKKLSNEQQNQVIALIAGKYGSDFAQQFSAFANSNIYDNQGRPQLTHSEAWIGPPWLGDPKTHPTPENLEKRLFKLQYESGAEQRYVNPFGAEVYIRFKTEERKKQKTDDSCKLAPEAINIPADSTQAYGPIVAIKAGFEFRGKKGDAFEYKNGVIEFYPQNEPVPITFVIQCMSSEEGKPFWDTYAVYVDGKKIARQLLIEEMATFMQGKQYTFAEE